VLRPGFVYGRSGSYVGDFFSAARKGVQNVAGDGSNHWSTVHVEDPARAYVMIAESGASVAGRIFNVSDHAFPTTKELALAASAYVSDRQHIPAHHVLSLSPAHLVDVVWRDGFVCCAWQGVWLHGRDHARSDLGQRVDAAV